MQNFFKLVYSCLELEWPCRVTYAKGTTENYLGWHIGKVNKNGVLCHFIKIYPDVVKLDSARPIIQTVLAHELVHAWQTEKGINNRLDHCIDFQEKAIWLENELENRGILDIGNIYVPELDIS